MALIGVEKCAILFYLIAGVFRESDGKNFACKNNVLISPSYFCDNDNDCKDGDSGSDESYGCDRRRCGAGKFACENSQCLPISVRCNAMYDCADGSDELYCDKAYFQCKNGDLIGGDWFCDKENDCADKSDESFGCTADKCGRGSFTCNSGECLPLSVRCDAKHDCPDGSDEIFCDHVFSLEKCTLLEGKYLCKDKSRCMLLTDTCGGTKQYGCLDGSYEDVECYGPTDTCDLTCPYACWRSPDGPVCLCNSTDSSNHSLCNKVADCDSEEERGEKRCVKFDGVIQRSCNEGYTQQGVLDGLCVSEVPYANVLLYSDQHNIVGYDMTNRRKVFIQNENNVTSISAAHDNVYWSVFSNNISKIFKTKMLYQRETETIYSSPSSGSIITCIALDWISNNTFFTSQTTLSVCNDDGSACAQLKYSTHGIECVALLPRKGLMFWIENTESKYSGARIIKSSMDGSDEQVVVNENLRYSNYLTVDESSEKIYWMDLAASTIESIKYTGRQRKMVVPRAWSTAFFTVFEGILYHALKSDNGIFMRINDDAWLKADSDIKKIHIFNPVLQTTKVSNPCVRAPCPGLCLLRPVSPPPEFNFTCLYNHPEITIEYSTISSPGYEHLETTIGSRDVSKLSTGSTTVDSWSPTTTTVPINCNQHVTNITEKDTRILLAIDVFRTLEEHLSTFGDNVTIMLKILLVTLILFLSVVTTLLYYYVKSSKARYNINDGLFLTEMQ